MSGYIGGPFVCVFTAVREVHDTGLSFCIQGLAEVLEVPSGESSKCGVKEFELNFVIWNYAFASTLHLLLLKG